MNREAWAFFWLALSAAGVSVFASAYDLSVTVRLIQERTIVDTVRVEPDSVVLVVKMEAEDDSTWFRYQTVRVLIPTRGKP